MAELRSGHGARGLVAQMSEKKRIALPVLHVSGQYAPTFPQYAPTFPQYAKMSELV